jgi:uncharacterized protein
LNPDRDLQAIDCDVHCAPQSFQALFPYLSEYWRQYITDAGIRLTGMAHAYPAGAPTTASSSARALGATPTPASYEELKRGVLDRAGPRFAVLNCLTGFETHRNAYFSAAVASALNDWLREEFLVRDERLRASLVVATVSTEDAVAEIERLGDDRRFVQVLLPVRSDLPWGNKHRHPIFAAAREHSYRWGCTRWEAPARLPRRAASRPPISRITWEISSSPRRRS